MVYDLVELPMRFDKQATISTAVVLFQEYFDTVTILGRDVDVGKIVGNFHKYKTVEFADGITIERIFLCDAPIDITTEWWDADITIYPIYTKYYDGNHITLVKSLPGITGILSMIGPTANIMGTIHTYIASIVNNSVHNKLNGSQIPIGVLLQDMIVGGDIANINRMTTAMEIPETLSIGDCTPNYPKDSGMMLSHEPFNIRKLKTFKHKNFGLPMCSAIVATINPMFNVSATDVMYRDMGDDEDEDGIPDTRWSLHEIIEIIMEHPSTDLYLNITYLSKSSIIVDGEIYSRYNAKAKIFENASSFTGVDALLLENITKWVYYSIQKPIKSIRLSKNWLEELYIEITTTSNITHRHYIDLVMWSLGTLSIIED